MGKHTSTMVVLPAGGTTLHEEEFVYHDGEHPGWIESSSLGERRTTAHASGVPVVVPMPLTMLQYSVQHLTLHELYRRVSLLARDDLIHRYRNAYADGKRLVAGIMAVELIERGIPPCFWHEVLALDGVTIDQRADLVLTDLAWLRRWYPHHADVVRYRRGKALLTGNETVFRREAEFAFYQGRRPAWKLVGSMSMTERQQWDSAYLRSTPIKRHEEIAYVLSCRVRQALYDDLQAARRTATFTDADAESSLARRYALWRCTHMVKNMSPTEIAARYQQMTGMTITRQAAAKQLQKVHAVLRARGVDFAV